MPTAAGVAAAHKIMYQADQGLAQMNIHHISRGAFHYQEWTVDGPRWRQVLAGPSPVEIVWDAEYLMLLGAKPDQQSRGLGSALLTHRLARLDAVGMPSYLEATTRRSAKGVYTRAGHRPLGDPIQFSEGLQVYPLWRDPPRTPGVL